MWCVRRALRWELQTWGFGMGVRQSVAGLSTAGVAGVRAGFSALYALRDERGYGYFAGLHGLPLPSYCEHGTTLFLPWHRAYLYMFERALQDRTPGVDVPWWNWSSDAARRQGLPTAFADRNLSPGQPNPLAAGLVALSAADLARVRQQLPGAITAGRSPRTRRDPDQPAELPRQVTLQRLARARTFADFSMLAEGIHNSVHGWVGGAMSAVPVAAFDPIFWAHHAMIDRLWYLWQIGPNGVDPPAALLDRALPPFPMTVSDTLDISTLGYSYATRVVG